MHVPSTRHGLPTASWRAALRPRKRSAKPDPQCSRVCGEGYDWRAILRALSTTTLVLHGEQDVLPPAVSLEDARILTNARHVVVPASGHMPFWEAPERFFALLESFLRAR